MCVCVYVGVGGVCGGGCVWVCGVCVGGVGYVCVYCEGRVCVSGWRMGVNEVHVFVEVTVWGW